MQDLRIIDTLGPFMSAENDGMVNWSKVPFMSLEHNGMLDAQKTEKIVRAFKKYIHEASQAGYNAMSIDDLAHLVVHDFYSSDAKKLLIQYRQLYSRLFAIAAEHNMRILVNSDYMFYTKDIEVYTQRKPAQLRKLFALTIEKALREYPQIAGIILRIGESDGHDVQGMFLSELTLHSSRDARTLLKTLLPLFEQSDRLLIFRTWTVGTYGLGDLMWNQKTYDRVFKTIKSEHLIVSLKYGNTDFFRYLALNPLTLHGQHKKIIEFQAKREWEGMGLYPSFVGWDYAHYLQQLKQNKQIVGIQVWAQTGGWAPAEWGRLTFLERSGFWNELNAFVTAQLYGNNYTTEEAIEAFCSFKKIENVTAFTHFLRLADVAIKNGLYISAFAAHPLYLRRIQLPPLTWVAWDNVLANGLTKQILTYAIKDRQSVIDEGEHAVEIVEQMIVMAQQIDLPNGIVDSLRFQLATFRLLAQIRRLIFGTLSDIERQQLNRDITAYQKRYPQHYRFSLNIQSNALGSHASMLLIPLLIRHQSAYRRFDYFLLRTSGLQRFIVHYYIKKTIPYLSTQAMGLESVFK